MNERLVCKCGLCGFEWEQSKEEHIHNPLICPNCGERGDIINLKRVKNDI
jgi:Zn finger protein HypA/HybF involved in hydrogenase expression